MKMKLNAVTYVLHESKPADFKGQYFSTNGKKKKNLGSST